MERCIIFQGRTISADDIAVISGLIANYPTWNRTRLSRLLCRRWGWVNGNGRLKDMAVRAVLRKLDAHSLIHLPAPIHSANNAFRHGLNALVKVFQKPITGGLSTKVSSTIKWSQRI